MAEPTENGSSNGSSNGRFEGYSHYQTVSSSIAESIDEALSAYTELDSLHAENAKVGAQQAARARSRIKLAALKLVPELREDAHHNEQYQQILARWHGGFKIDTAETQSAEEEVQPGELEAEDEEVEEETEDVEEFEDDSEGELEEEELSEEEKAKQEQKEEIQPNFPHETPAAGYFDALSEIRLQQECPDWLEDWVIDIRTAGWEIGYLQAGRSVSPEPDVPDPDEEFESMFADY